MTVEIDYEGIEEFGAVVEFKVSGVVVTGYSCETQGELLLVEVAEAGDLPRTLWGMHFVLPAEVESVEVER